MHLIVLYLNEVLSLNNRDQNQIHSIITLAFGSINNLFLYEVNIIIIIKGVCLHVLSPS